MSESRRRNVDPGTCPTWLNHDVCKNKGNIIFCFFCISRSPTFTISYGGPDFSSHIYVSAMFRHVKYFTSAVHVRLNRLYQLILTNWTSELNRHSGPTLEVRWGLKTYLRTSETVPLTACKRNAKNRKSDKKEEIEKASERASGGRRGLGWGGVSGTKVQICCVEGGTFFDAVTTPPPSFPLPLLPPANLTPDVWGLLGVACQDE